MHRINSVVFCPQAVTDPLIAPVSENISIDVNRKLSYSYFYHIIIISLCPLLGQAPTLCERVRCNLISGPSADCIFTWSSETQNETNFQTWRTAHIFPCQTERSLTPFFIAISIIYRTISLFFLWEYDHPLVLDLITPPLGTSQAFGMALDLNIDYKKYRFPYDIFLHLPVRT